MEKRKQFNFVCDGKVQGCQQDRCFYKTGNIYACMHTIDPEHALNFNHGACNRANQYWEKPPKSITKAKKTIAIQEGRLHPKTINDLP